MEDEDYSGGMRKTVVMALAGLTVLLLIQIFLRFRAAPLKFDENGNFCRILSFLHGTWRMQDCGVVALPGYHALVAALLSLTGSSSASAARTVSFVLNLCGCIPVYLIARNLHRASALLRTLEVITLPILLPFFPLLYTDLLGMTLLLWSLYAALCRQAFLSALLLTAAVAVRQNAILWLPLVAFVSFGGSRRPPFRLWGMFLLPLLLFCTFLWLNGSASLNRAAVTPSVSFSVGNVFFALFLFTSLFLPLVLLQIRKVAALLTERRRVWLVLLAGALLFLLGFRVTHPVNLQGGQVRDMILLAVSAGGKPRLVFFLATAFALLTLIVTPLEIAGSSPYMSREGSIPRLFYLSAFLSLASIWLIETRYALPALVLFLLLRKPMPWRWEVLQVAYNLLLCLWVFL